MNGGDPLSPESERFVALLASQSALGPGGTQFFESARDLVFTRAPGRLDVMGGIADYSGSQVLELPLADAAFVAAQPARDGFMRIVSVGPADGAPPRHADIPLAELTAGYGRARAFFERAPELGWASYLAGAVVALSVERRIDVAGAGLRLLLTSFVAEGSGVSSSAAISVAAASALIGVSARRLDATALALVCQKVENQVAGAPSGVMDPMTAVLGEAGHLLSLLCQPARVLGQVAVPDVLSFSGVDSGVRHAVSGADYRAVRVGAFMGYRILAEREGVRVERMRDHVVIDDARFGGYLANLDLAEFEARHAEALPLELSGAEFLARYGGISDLVTVVDPRRSYPVRHATRHPIAEHARVRRFAELLRGDLDVRARNELGALMFASHASYSACGLGSPGTDRLVALAREAGPNAGIHGAKISGGGSGGAVVFLAERGAEAAVESIAARYAAETKLGGRVFRGSSNGAAAFGARRLLSGSPRGSIRIEIVP